MLLWKAAMCIDCTAGPAKCLSHSVWPCLRWASLIDQTRGAAQWEVCAPSWGTQTRKTGALLRRDSIKGQGMFFLLSGTERAEKYAVYPAGPQKGTAVNQTPARLHTQQLPRSTPSGTLGSASEHAKTGETETR